VPGALLGTSVCVVECETPLLDCDDMRTSTSGGGSRADCGPPFYVINRQVVHVLTEAVNILILKIVQTMSFELGDCWVFYDESKDATSAGAAAKNTTSESSEGGPQFPTIMAQT